METAEPERWRSFADHLALEQVDGTAYVGSCLSGRGQRVFGGHVGAHAVVAAATSSASERVPRSIHLTFLSAGDCSEPVRYDATLLRGGRTLERWRVDASQGSTLIATSVVALDRVEESAARHAVTAEGVDVDPEGLPSIAQAPRPGTSRTIRQAFDMREGVVVADDGSGSPRRDVWFRCTEVLPDDRALRAAVVVFASDLELAWTADLPHVQRISARWAASMDHTVWLHTDWDLKEWWLYRLRSPALEERRAFVTGEFHPRGEGVSASVAQQALVRMTLRDG